MNDSLIFDALRKEWYEEEVEPFYFEVIDDFEPFPFSLWLTDLFGIDVVEEDTL